MKLRIPTAVHILLLAIRMSPLLIVIFGVWHLIVLIHHLNRPIYNLSIRFKGQREPATLQIQRTEFDFENGEIRLLGASLKNQRGKTVLFAKNLGLSLPVPWIHRRTVEVNVSGGHAEVVRRPDGSLDLLGLLPPSETEKPSETPYSVRLSNIDLHYVDMTGESDCEIDGKVRDGVVVGAAGLSVGTATLDIPNAGALRTQFELDQDGLAYLQVDTDNFEFAHLLPSVQRIREWNENKIDQITAQRASFQGNVAVWRSGSWRWTCSGTLRASALHYGRHRIGTVEATGAADWRQAAGRISAFDRRTQANGEVAVRWSPLQVRFDGTVRSDDPTFLQRLTLHLPKELDWRGLTWSGSIAYQDSLVAFGVAQVRELRVKNVSAHNTTGSIILNADRLRLYQLNSTIAGGRVSADISVNLDDGAIAGFAHIDGADPHKVPYLPETLRDHIMRGSLNGQVLVSGTLSAPSVRASIHGAGEVVFPGEAYTVVDQPEISAVLAYNSNRLEIESFIAGGRSGSILASGSFDFSSSSADIDLRANAIDLLAYPDAPVFGTAYADLRLSGPLNALRVEGPVEVYGVGNGNITIPIVTSQVSIDSERRISLSALHARHGSSELTGSLNLAPSGDTWAIAGEGTLRNLSLSAASNGELVGLADGTWNARGTLQKPIIEATLASDTMFVRDLPVKQVHAQGRWQDDVLYLDKLAAEFADGKLTGSGTYALKGDSNVNFSLENLNISNLAAILGEAVIMDGRTSASGFVHFSDGTLDRAQTSLEASSISLNGQPIGNGAFDLVMNGDTAHLNGSIGSLDGYFVLDKLVYNLQTGEYGLSAGILNLPARAVRTFAESLLATLPDEAQEHLRNMDALLTLNLELEGVVSPNPDARRTEQFVTAGKTSVEISDLSLRSEPLGKLRAEAEKAGTLWKFTSLNWTDGPVGVRLLGSAANSLDENGDVEIDLEVYNVRLADVSRALALPQPLAGTANLVLSARGQSNSPIILSSLDASSLTIGDSPQFDVSLAGVRIADGAITLDPNDGVGYLNLKSFQARLDEASVPFRYPFAFPDEPLTARITVPQRDLNAVSDFFGGLDTAVTSGTIREGTILVSGTVYEPNVTGEIAAEAERLAFSGLDQIFHNAKAYLKLTGAEASWNAEVHDDTGGTIKSQGTVDLSTSEIKSANLDVDQFLLRQEIGDRNRFSATLTGNLTASGQIMEPVVSGVLNATRGSVVLAGDFPESEPPMAWLVRPTFDIQLAAEPFKFASGPLKATVTADGALRGTLDSLTLRSEFLVQDGSLALPTSDLRFSPGSKAVLVYAPGQEFGARAKLDVTLNATTLVTASNGINVQQYRIFLTITGDALSDQDFNILATSDPPDLTREQIMAILGQQQLLEDVAGAAVGGFRNQLTEAIGNVLAPVLARSVSRSLEKTLGLDYLAFDIRPGNPTAITLVKTLGSGFSLEYRRTLELFEQIDTPLEEIGLTFVPRTRNPILSRVRISVVGQRDGILRLSIGYWQRF